MKHEKTPIGIARILTFWNHNACCADGGAIRTPEWDQHERGRVFSIKSLLPEYTATPRDARFFPGRNRFHSRRSLKDHRHGDTFEPSDVVHDAASAAAAVVAFSSSVVATYRNITRIWLLSFCAQLRRRLETWRKPHGRACRINTLHVSSGVRNNHNATSPRTLMSIKRRWQ